jgi:hypothetical protein
VPGTGGREAKGESWQNGSAENREDSIADARRTAPAQLFKKSFHATHDFFEIARLILNLWIWNTWRLAHAKSATQFGVKSRFVFRAGFISVSMTSTHDVIQSQNHLPPLFRTAWIDIVRLTAPR